MCAFITIPAALMLAVGAPPVVSAQTLRGQVIDSVLHVPVGAGFVVLVGPDGQEVTRTLTTRDGRFTIHLQPGQLGPLRVRSERIGYRVAVTEPFPAPTDGSVEFIIRVHALPTLLSEIEVQEASECRMRPEASERTA